MAQLGGYENPKAVEYKSGLAEAGAGAYRVVEAMELAKRKKEADKKLLEDGAIDRTDPFQNESLAMRRKGSKINNFDSVATMLVDKYYVNEKNYAQKKLDPEEYRRVRQNLWDNLGKLKTVQTDIIGKTASFLEDSRDDLVSSSAKGLQKRIKFESVLKGNAEIGVNDDGLATLIVRIPDSTNKGGYIEQEQPIDYYVSNPENLGYDKKADLTNMAKTMGTTAMHGLDDEHDEANHTVFTEKNIQRFYYNREKAKKLLNNNDEFNTFVTGNLESIVEDYMNPDTVFVPDDPNNPEQHKKYLEQLEDAKSWFGNHIYDTTPLGRQIDKRVLPTGGKGGLDFNFGGGGRRGRTHDEYVVPKQAAKVEKFNPFDTNKDARTEALKVIDPRLSMSGLTVMKSGKEFFYFNQGADVDEELRRFNIKLGYIKQAPVIVKPLSKDKSKRPHKGQSVLDREAASKYEKAHAKKPLPK